MENLNMVAENVRKLRAKAGLTQEQLAMFIGISDKELNAYEENIVEVDLKFIDAVCLFFGVEMLDFFEKDLSSVNTPMALAFRSNELTAIDYEGIRKFKKIIANYTKMKKINAND